MGSIIRRLIIQTIPGIGFHIGYAGKSRKELGPAPASGSSLEIVGSHESSHLLGQGSSHKLIDGDSLACSELSHPLVKGIRKSDA